MLENLQACFYKYLNAWNSMEQHGLVMSQNGIKDLRIYHRIFYEFQELFGVFFLSTANDNFLVPFCRYFNTFFKLQVAYNISSVNRSSQSQKSMTELCQIEILNFLWLNWVQYLPLAPTQINIPPSHPQGGVQIYPNANLLGKIMNLKVHHPQQRLGGTRGYINLCGS